MSSKNGPGSEMLSHVQDGSVSTALIRDQIRRLLESPTFSGSEVLRNLLSFLAEHSISSPGEALKEYQVAVGVLGKPEGFDPRLDSAVRVHTARLRAKLAEYYMSEGASDKLLIEVPKGAYQLLWRQRKELTAGVPGVRPPATPKPAPVPAPKPWQWKGLATGFAVAMVLASIAAGFAIFTRSEPAPSRVQAFWKPFLRSPQSPIIVFSNHRFIGSSATTLHSFREGIDSPLDINDTYSGTGTVMAVGELTGLFSRFGSSPRLKRAELLTWDEAKDANVVFVGAPEANSRLRELAPLRHFKFKSSIEEPNLGIGGIVNVHPASGEEAVYFGSGRPYTFDYAVIALLPSLRQEHKVLILAGTNTYGCQAAAEFLDRQDTVQQLYDRLHVSGSQGLPDFEALIQVNVSGGVPIEPRLIIARRHR